MPRLTHQDPKFRRHASGQAVVTLNKQDIYLGPYGSPDAKIKYHRILAEWREQRGATPAYLLPASKQQEGVSVGELGVRYYKHAVEYYKGSREIYNLRAAFAFMVHFYEHEPVNNIRPTHLRVIREEMVKPRPEGKPGWSRKHVNSQVKRILRVLKWGVSNELVKPDVLAALREIEPLKRGRTVAPDHPPIEPVAKLLMARTCRFLPPTIRTMVLLQYHTGMRPGEVCRFRFRDVDKSRKTWVYSPPQHKTAHHGHERRIYLGKHAQLLLKPYLGVCPDDEYVFSPKRAMAERYAKRSMHRRVPSAKPKTKRRLRDRYQTAAYSSAIRTACVAGKLESWAPNQIRHAFGTRVREEKSFEAAQVLLGHRSPSVTATYAKPSEKLAIETIDELG